MSMQIVCCTGCEPMTYRSASLFSIDELVGKRVVALQDFSGIPSGTVGEVVSKYETGRIGNKGKLQHHGVMVRWTTTAGYDVEDGFGRDAEFDETKFLAVIE